MRYKEVSRREAG